MANFPSQADSQSPPARRILVVDDQAMNRRLLETVLKNAGHAVETCRDGVEAVDAVRKSDFDVILMDIEMPAMNGLQATREIRRMGKDAANLPIIALTGHSDPTYLSFCLQEGANEALSKPVNLDHLPKIIERWVRPRS